MNLNYNVFQFISICFLSFSLSPFRYQIYFNQIAIVVLMAIACANAKPGIIAPVAYSAPIVAPAAAALPYVTATSSQVVRVKLFAQNMMG